jgi:hypothetical protein
MSELLIVTFKDRPEWDCGDPSHHHRSTLHARECRRKSGREEAA